MEAERANLEVGEAGADVVAGGEEALHDERGGQRIVHSHVLRHSGGLSVPVQRAVTCHQRSIEVLLLVGQVAVAVTHNTPHTDTCAPRVSVRVEYFVQSANTSI